MESECLECGWSGPATELGWYIPERGAVVNGDRVCPKCRSNDFVLRVRE